MIRRRYIDGLPTGPGTIMEVCGNDPALARRVQAAFLSSYRSCSWCRILNPVAERWCAACGHAAHKPRMVCDCGACRPGPGAYVSPPPRPPAPN